MGRAISIGLFVYGTALCVFFAVSLWFALPINNKLFVDMTSVDRWIIAVDSVLIPIACVVSIWVVYRITLRKTKKAKAKP